MIKCKFIFQGMGGNSCFLKSNKLSFLPMVLRLQFLSQFMVKEIGMGWAISGKEKSPWKYKARFCFLFHFVNQHERDPLLRHRRSGKWWHLVPQRRTWRLREDLELAQALGILIWEPRVNKPHPGGFALSCLYLAGLSKFIYISNHVGMSEEWIVLPVQISWRRKEEADF